MKTYAKFGALVLVIVGVLAWLALGGIPTSRGAVALGMRRRRWRTLEFEHHVVWVAVLPVLAWLEGADDRVTNGLVMPGRVLSG